jgi:acetyl-CoA/propionyl-CoA carboxylase biotin carboxyl carrier protein
VAAGEPLGVTQDEIELRGHAVEVRVCAEDPAAGFLPATGEILSYSEPHGLRTDSGVRRGTQVTTLYDSLLAKVIAHEDDREAALAAVSRGLAELTILGVTTNSGFLRRLVDAEPVRRGEIDTGLIERGVADAEPDPAEARQAALALALIELLALHERAPAGDPWDTLVAWRQDGSAPVALRLLAARAKEPLRVSVSGPPHAAHVQLDENVVDAAVERLDAERVVVRTDVTQRVWRHASRADEHWLASGADTFAFRLVEPMVQGGDAGSEGALEAPMPGRVLSVNTEEGCAVEQGDVLVVIESMKMELSLTAPAAATVGAVHVSEGQSVRQGQAVVELVVDGE